MGSLSNALKQSEPVARKWFNFSTPAPVLERLYDHAWFDTIRPPTEAEVQLVYDDWRGKHDDLIAIQDKDALFNRYLYSYLSDKNRTSGTDPASQATTKGSPPPFRYSFDWDDRFVNVIGGKNLNIRYCKKNYAYHCKHQLRLNDYHTFCPCCMISNKYGIPHVCCSTRDDLCDIGREMAAAGLTKDLSDRFRDTQKALLDFNAKNKPSPARALPVYVTSNADSEAYELAMKWYKNKLTDEQYSVVIKRQTEMEKIVIYAAAFFILRNHRIPNVKSSKQHGEAETLSSGHDRSYELGEIIDPSPDDEADVFLTDPDFKIVMPLSPVRPAKTTSSTSRRKGSTPMKNTPPSKREARYQKRILEKDDDSSNSTEVPAKVPKMSSPTTSSTTQSVASRKVDLDNKTATEKKTPVLPVLPDSDIIVDFYPQVLMCVFVCEGYG